MTYQDTVHAPYPYTAEEDAAPTGAGWLLPAIGASVLTLIWGAYTLTIVYHMAVLPLP